MKLSSIVFLILYVSIMTGIVSAAGIDKVTITNITDTSGENDIVTSINFNNAENVGSIQLDILYDPEVLKAKSVDKGSLLPSDALFVFNTENTQKVTISIVSLNGISGTGSIANITFEVTGSTGNSGNLDIEVVATDPENNHIDVANVLGMNIIIGGPVTTYAITATPTVSATSTSTPVRATSTSPATPISTTTVKIKSNVSNSTDAARNTTNNITATAISTPKTTPVQTTVKVTTTMPAGIKKEPGFQIISFIAAVLVIYIVMKKE